MSGLRNALVVVTGTAAVVVASACAESIVDVSGEAPAEPERVPDPPPRYAHALVDAGVPVPEEDASGEPQLKMECRPTEPYVCSLDDGTFRCSEIPCLPTCERVGCLSGERCVECGGSYRCVGSGEADCSP